MKLSIKFLALAALFITMSLSVSAQRGGMSGDPAERAEKEIARLIEELGLDETQIAKVKEISIVYGEKMQQSREENKGNREAMKEISEAINAEKSAEMKMILNEDQFKKYETIVAKNGERKGRKGGKGGRRGNK